MRLPLSSPRRGAAGKPALVVLFFVAAGLLGYFLYTRLLPANKPAPEGEPAAPVAQAEAVSLPHGEKLYDSYCMPCHGARGTGDGPAARYLYPRPRNFGEAKFRLASTANRMPTDQDLLQVITHGMPGSAMFPFAHLSEADRKSLVLHVQHLIRAAVVERARSEAAARGEEVDQVELSRDVEQLLQPGEVLALPTDLPPAGAESVARGQHLYRDKGCAACHGETGKGDGGQEQRDDSGMPTRPRDFTRGIFKGGRQPESLYTRIRIGLPGTPMPGSPDLKPDEVGDLINFVLSLSDPASQQHVEHQRQRLVARKAAGLLGEEISEQEWQASAPVRLVVSPLWWRNYPEPDLHVAALHDGKSLAIRLTWRDETRDDHPVRPQDFEDMAAVQLFKGSPEPFLGMGAAGQALDVWLWRPTWQQKPADYADVDTTYPHMAVDLYPFEQPGGGPRPHATERQAPDFLTARAAGNLQADPTRGATGGNLRAGGFGTLTMQPRVSQVVSARGNWKDGRWTIVLRRSLEVKADAGLPLAAGDQLSIAFALWDGAAGDRNGQKLVSIWHDLQLE